jgi:hypothetical protein
LCSSLQSDYPFLQLRISNASGLFCTLMPVFYLKLLFLLSMYVIVKSYRQTYKIKKERNEYTRKFTIQCIYASLRVAFVLYIFLKEKMAKKISMFYIFMINVFRPKKEKKKKQVFLNSIRFKERRKGLFVVTSP